MVPKEKMEQLTEQYRATLRGLTGSVEAWQRFLRLAAYQYKYSFPEQVLIYAQRPTATACAPIELWNRRFHRFVSRGSKGIALFTERNGRVGIRYVFDVGDTVGREPFALWQVPDGMESLVADALEVRLDDGEQFPQAVFSACMNAVEENDGDYFENLCQSRADSRLAAYPQPELQSRFRTALWMSVSESVMIRLGMDPRTVSPADYFSVVTDFNTPETVNLLGVATSDLSERCLRTVERTVLAHRTFDKPPVIGYDKGEQKSTEQGGEHHDLHEPERIPTPKPDAPAAEETPARQVREDAPELSQSPPQGNLHHAPDRSETLGTPLGDRADGEGAGPADGGADGGGAGGERADETAEPDALDADDEQSESVGGGDRSERPDLHITEEEPDGRHEPEPNGIMPVSLPDHDFPYEIHPGTDVYIGDVECTVTIMEDDRVELFDGTLLPLEMDLATFRRRVAENPLNNRLKSGGTEPQKKAESTPPAKKEKRVRKEKTPDYLADLERDFARWETLYEEGGSDPSWADGVNLNLVRNHILYGLREAAKVYAGQELPEICSREPPPEVPNDYMAKPDAIRENAKRVLEQMRVDGDYIWCRTNAGLLPPKVRERISVNAVLGYVSRLESAIAEDNLLTMRLYKSPERYFESFLECKVRMEKQLSERENGEESTILPFPEPDFEEEEEPIAEPEPKEIRVSRVGDFYEFFGEDAKTVANLLELTLTSRRMPDDTRTPMCGIPFHKRDPYFQQLSDAGYAVTEVPPPWEEPQPDPDDLEAEQAINRHEAEYGADGFRAFRDEERIRKAEASMPTALEAPKEPEQSPPEPPRPPMRGERRDYRIPSDQIGVGTPGERYENNVRAIRLLKALENENRLATAEEQEILARYVGWGGLADAFEEGNRRYGELKDLLTEEEYQAAKESTLTAFYTPPVVIDAVWRALGNMGFVRGNVLEPSCGIGNFMGRLPDGMKDAKFYGVEIDRISGRIARQLYQNQQITVTGFEKTAFPRNFFDLAVGNVPFGNFGISDPNYDKFRFLIHDYFFAKALDQVRPGGIVAFVTAKGTMDKKDNTVRKYLAERAELLGAIRLPDSTFRGAAGTEVVSDILFLQKRDHMTALEPDWVHLGIDANGFPINSYFADHPEMIAGEMTVRSGPFGPESTCRLPDGETLADHLSAAVAHLRGEIAARGEEELSEEETNERIPADPAVRNFSFTLVDGKIYYRENSVMYPVKTSQAGENRVRGMIALRDTVRELIDAQLRGAGDGEVHDLQARLNRQYDDFTKKYGIINSRGNENAFSDDSSYFLLCSLEILDDDKQFEKKADLFTKRTINPERTVDHVDTAAEALAVSIGERAAIDMEWMGQLLGGRSEEELYADLRGVIFLNPAYEDDPTVPKYLMADEYLSGNVREKLQAARAAAEKNPATFSVHVEALERVQPADLTATEIGVRLGSTWIPERFVQQFMKELLDLSLSYYFEPKVKYIPELARWVISNKSSYYGNIKINNTYGTKRINAFEIIEETLNLRDVRIVDYEEDEGGKKKPVLNKKETAIAQGKQDQIKRAFEDWIWKDRTRRETLCRLYNDRFNSVRPRAFDGSHIRFSGMSPEITLRRHQVNAVARILYGGNTLLAHVVGAGKTYTMVAAAQESRRLGLCNKSMFVVPNHLIEQWASEYLQLYPAANILVANKKDFETKNRKKFCARIATGDYDAVIIGHSQFEKIPMSVQRQMEMIQDEINGIVESIEKVKFDRGERVTVKQLERTKKQLQLKLDKLNSQERKDDVVTFEQLGVDRLFIDEAHFYKNLFLFTKMRNVAGIAQTEAQKSSDLYLKCRYLDEQTGGRGVVFATGTPISNSMVELYTMQRYLQYDALRQNGLEQFDAWASTFGETVTAIELSPDGSGYRTKTRFAKFFNIPELMSLFRQVADVQTADMLNLPVPVAHYSVEKVTASEIQKDLVKSFADRAARVHNRMVPANEDNMLLITNDGRKTALDQRLINPLLPDEEGSKVNACVRNVYEIWERTAENKSAQMVFCDLSTPKGDGTFNVYDDIRGKLVAKGIPAEEIAFIHSADTDAKKKDLFRKVRSGQVRVLMGSTFKMGAGTNVQKRLIALHDLDCPWRPSDLEQRAGRIVRQGNDNPEVDIIRYITEGTFDAYSYQLLESKQKFISQIMTSKTPVRVAEDVDETALSYAEIKALASGNPKIMEKMQLDADVGKLKLQKASHLSQRYALEDDLSKKFPKEIAETESYIRGYEADRKTVAEHTVPGEKGFSPMTIENKVYPVKAEAGKRILELCKTKTDPAPQEIGSYRGMGMKLGFDQSEKEFFIYLTGKLTHRVPLGQDANGIITRLDNSIDSMETRQKNCEARLADLCRQVETAKEEINAPFPDEELLQEKCRRLDELNAELNLDRTENELADDGEEKSDSEPEQHREGEAR